VESAVISLLAGDVFALGRVRLHLFVFRCFYAVTWLKNWRRSMESRRLRLASLRSNAE
jgi:hypothetical protein